MIGSGDFNFCRTSPPQPAPPKTSSAKFETALRARAQGRGSWQSDAVRPIHDTPRLVLQPGQFNQPARAVGENDEVRSVWQPASRP
jgi:hypothetical protein